MGFLEKNFICKETMSKLNKKREKEQFIVKKMITIYCHKNHRTKVDLCNECQALYDYTKKRIEKCPFMEEKTFCANCNVHCYKVDMREKIKEVMRFSGPRMLFYRPLLVIWHVICSKREKKSK